MRTALIEQLTYREGKISLYLALDDDYRQREGDSYFFEIKHPELEETYTDSFASYASYQAARDAAMEAADRLARPAYAELKRQVREDRPALPDCRCGWCGQGAGRNGTSARGPCCPRCGNGLR